MRDRMLQIMPIHDADGVPDWADEEDGGSGPFSSLGRIPLTGITFEHPPARFTILDAEPQRVNRVRVELLPPTA